MGKTRFRYPTNHIEADNRLSWLMGRLDKTYGKNAFYVHLKRNDNATAESFANRYQHGIIKAYRETILLGCTGDCDLLALSLDYCDTANSNIVLFLNDKPNMMNFSLESAKKDFPVFWHRIGAEGDLDSALCEFDTPYNAHQRYSSSPSESVVVRAAGKFRRIAKTLPHFIANA